ncbi:MAG: T9SS type A sorting domain-containing protein [Ignavibacteriales bacterium]|nr:T9SS type A sorting domain-containing protein [Ignavibacteriales bacterium]
MKGIREVSLILFLLSQFCQAQWFWQHPNPQVNSLQAVCFSDSNNGTAVGYYGTIIHTIDGGKNWSVQESGTFEILRDVSFSDAKNGIIVGEHGLVLKTNDAGNTWNSQNSGTMEALYGVSFTDENNGTAVGVMGTILRTTNGGNNWTPQTSSVSGTFCALFSVSFTDSEHGTFVGSDGIVQHTIDGGITWKAQSSGTTKTLSAVSFLDENNGIAVGSGGTTIMTNNAGETWILKQVTENSLRGVSFSSNNNILIVGENATVVRVTNNGADWYRYYPAATKVESETDLFGVSKNTFVGEKGQIFCFNEIDSSWVAQRNGPISKLRGVCFTRPEIGTAIGHNGTILRTTDGGSNWTIQTFTSPNSGGSINDHLKAVSFYNEYNGFIVSGSSSGDGSIPYYGTDGLVLNTTNGGTNWHVKYSNSNAAFNGVSSPSANVCFAVGIFKILENGVYKDHAGWVSTTDGGANWQEKYFTSITDPLTAVSFINNNIGTMVGYNGRILRTTDGGNNWSTQASNTTSNLRGVHFVDENTGTIVGDYGTILRTTNAGILWNPQISGSNNDLNGVHFIDINHGRIVGANGIIQTTSDGGVTWEIQSTCTVEDLFAISFGDENCGNIVGDYGLILRTNNGGITSIINDKNSIISQNLFLYQNYPNPFNPTTTIKYQISSKVKSEKTNVKLVVYDILGREIVILVNKEQAQGNYEVEFDGRELSSGIYFYRLQTCDPASRAGQVFVETKKMILLK